MSSMQNRRATAGFASGFMTVTALFGLVAAMTTGFGPTQTEAGPKSHVQAGAAR